MEEKIKKEEKNESVKDNNVVEKEKNVKGNENDVQGTEKAKKVEKKNDKKENNPKKKKSKKWIIGIIIAIILIVVAIGAFISFHMSQLGALTAEIVKISEGQKNAQLDNRESLTVDMEIKTKGGYAVVEETMKNYINDLYTTVQNGENLIDIEEIGKIGSIENLKEDGPEFIKTKALIEETKQKISKYIADIKEKGNMEKIQTAIDNKEVGEYYKELYRQLVAENNPETTIEEAIKELEEAEKFTMEKIEQVSKIINFLSENKASWIIQNDQLLFKDTTKLKQYNNLVTELQK